MYKIFMEENSQYDYKFHIQEQKAGKKKMKKCVHTVKGKICTTRFKIL